MAACHSKDHLEESLNHLSQEIHLAIKDACQKTLDISVAHPGLKNKEVLMCIVSFRRVKSTVLNSKHLLVITSKIAEKASRTSRF